MGRGSGRRHVGGTASRLPVRIGTPATEGWRKSGKVRRRSGGGPAVVRRRFGGAPAAIW